MGRINRCEPGQEVQPELADYASQIVDRIVQEETQRIAAQIASFGRTNGTVCTSSIGEIEDPDSPESILDV